MNYSKLMWFIMIHPQAIAAWLMKIFL